MAEFVPHGHHLTEEQKQTPEGAAVAAILRPTETIFDPLTFRPKKQDTSIARAAVERKVKALSFRFFFAAVLSAAEFGILVTRDPWTALPALAVSGLFLWAGLMARRMNKKAFLATLIFYLGDTALLTIRASTSSIGALGYIFPILAHLFVCYRLHSAYMLIRALHELEADVA
jgi:hypothetical protein